jgi:hypothetical protein
MDPSLLASRQRRIQSAKPTIAPITAPDNAQMSILRTLRPEEMSADGQRDSTMPAIHRCLFTMFLTEAGSQTIQPTRFSPPADFLRMTSANGYFIDHSVHP